MEQPKRSTGAKVFRRAQNNKNTIHIKMSLQYPLNPDTSFESFTLTDEVAQKAIFGKTFSPNDLVPMNYQKIMLACKAGTLTYAPLREFSSIQSNVNDVGSTESGFKTQSIQLRSTLLQLLSYWNTAIALVAPFQCPLGIVTDIQQTNAFLRYDVDSDQWIYNVQHTIKVNWFVVPGSLYS
jgi:hypothetical protein